LLQRSAAVGFFLKTIIDSTKYVDCLTDNVIKVWRLFPYAAESLSPMMSFYCSQTPLHMCIMTGKLGVAFHEHASATYSVVVYNIGNRGKLL